MIEIKVNANGEKTEVKCNVKIDGRKNAVNQFYAVIKALSDCDESVLCDALERHLDDIFGGDDDDNSEC